MSKHRSDSINIVSCFGFTLIELAVVLVIIGLVVGGVLVGQDLIQSAQNRSVITEIEKFKSAVNAYKLKFNALPGDDPNATQFWGTMSGGCPAGGGTGTQTCNGDGDGYVCTLGNNGTPATERFLFWQHLSNAGLITGKYTGIYGAGSALDHKLGINAPVSSAVANAGYGIYNLGLFTDSNWFLGDYTETFVFGSRTGSGAIAPVAHYPLWGAIASADSFFIDNKTDDGLPGTGSTRSLTSNWTPCVTTANATTSVYNFSDKKPDCVLLFMRAF